MTTLVSVSLVCIRLILNAWATISAWRTAFILLETTGMTLRQLCLTASFGIPFSVFDWTRTCTTKSPGKLATAWSLFLICALLLPGQLAAPIASGSVSWIPRSISSPSPSPLRGITVPGPGYKWNWYQMFPAVRNTLVLRSAAYATMITAQTSAHQAAVPAWRGVPSAYDLPLKTTVHNITIPYFDIQAWEWVRDISILPDAVRNAVTGDGVLNITSEDNPLQDPVEGNAALLKTDPWRSSQVASVDGDGTQHYAYPSPRIIVAQKKYVAVLAQRVPGESCRPISDTFGNLGVPDSSFLKVGHSNNHTDCYMFASFNVTAGSQVCMHCNVSHPSTVSAPSVPTDRTGDAEILPDPLVDEVLGMLPEVMRAVASMNVTEGSQFGRLEQWTQQLLKQAYFATWTVMSIYCTDPEKATLSSSKTTPFQIVQASVSAQRMWLWLALNALVTLSGLMLLCWQSSCKRKPVVDVVLAAVMLDPRELLDEDKTGLCNASRLTSADDAVAILRLRRAMDERENSHFVLDKST
ncbi:hypothetical protein B0H67DRAFT_551532 [Lasiosphaeris hirsuta]|uniref:Uncharacterized protein n=1 Tax=Lasiosphaeris hirsuta TaxID=260670 RepID=A0AA40B1W5_9PEZI|nr:hypothetical protein B0H67DRAFT_551532 [Lasiosphaeris hirsuta]